MGEHLLPQQSPFAYLSLSHTALFYSEEGSLLRTLQAFVTDSIAADRVAVIVATKSHTTSLARSLETAGVDVKGRTRAGLLLFMDANHVLSRCISKGELHAGTFLDLMGASLSAAATARPSSEIMVYGELVAILWASRILQPVMQVETLWRELSQTIDFSLLCGYPIHDFQKLGEEDAYANICCAHTTIIPPDDYVSFEFEARAAQAARQLWNTIPEHRKAEQRWGRPAAN